MNQITLGKCRINVNLFQGQLKTRKEYRKFTTLGNQRFDPGERNQKHDE